MSIMFVHTHYMDMVSLCSIFFMGGAFKSFSVLFFRCVCWNHVHNVCGWRLSAIHTHYMDMVSLCSIFLGNENQNCRQHQYALDLAEKIRRPFSAIFSVFYMCLTMVALPHDGSIASRCWYCFTMLALPHDAGIASRCWHCLTMVALPHDAGIASRCWHCLTMVALPHDAGIASRW